MFFFVGLHMIGTASKCHASLAESVSGLGIFFERLLEISTMTPENGWKWLWGAKIFLRGPWKCAQVTQKKAAAKVGFNVSFCTRLHEPFFFVGRLMIGTSTKCDVAT